MNYFLARFFPSARIRFRNINMNCPTHRKPIFCSTPTWWTTALWSPRPPWTKANLITKIDTSGPSYTIHRSMVEHLSKSQVFQKPLTSPLIRSTTTAIWDWIILILVIYTAIFIPYQAAFVLDNSGHRNSRKAALKLQNENAFNNGSSTLGLTLLDRKKFLILIFLFFHD